MKVEVRKSPIHGRGLFAAEQIPKDSLIGIARGHAVKRDGAYVLWLDEDVAYRVTCKLRFINHSRQANAAYNSRQSVAGNQVVWVEAVKNIEPGEEITHDYGEEWN